MAQKNTSQSNRESSSGFNPFVQGADMWNQAAQYQFERMQAFQSGMLALEGEAHRRTKQAVEDWTKLYDQNLALSNDLIKQWQAATMTVVRKSADLFTGK